MDLKTIELAKNQAEMCRVFGSANRVLILWALGGQEMSVSAIAEMIDASLQNTSQHLRLMKDKNILSSRRVGNTIYYRVRPDMFEMNCQLFALAQQLTRINECDPAKYLITQEESDG
jgi:ArsR family transcriptional regulator